MNFSSHVAHAAHVKLSTGEYKPQGHPDFGIKHVWYVFRTIMIGVVSC